MSGLEIDSYSSERLRTLQELATITPAEKDPEPTPSTKHYQSQAELQQKNFEIFWEKLITIFIKIPFIKNLMLFTWKLGLKSAQPSNPIHNPNSLLFNSSIEIPKWFDDQMCLGGVLTLKDYILAELKMVAEKGSANLNTLARLSQIHISPQFYQYQFAIKALEKGIKETIHTITQRMQDAHPTEPLQLHLGRRSHENPLKRRPLSGLFIQSFAAYLRKHGNKTPICALHIHGPCDNNKALGILLKSLRDCPRLSFLHLDLDEESSKNVFKFLDGAIARCRALEFLVFRNYNRKHRFWVLTEDWDRLANAIKSHDKLRSLSFYDLPSPPQKFRERLQNYEITLPINTDPHGFCIKNLERLR